MRRPSTRALVVTGLVVSLLLAGVVSFYASAHPDGLAVVARQVGIGAPGGHASDGSPLAGYAVRGVSNSRLSGGLAGVLGVLVVAAVAFGLVRLLARRSRGED